MDFPHFQIISYIVNCVIYTVHYDYTRIENILIQLTVSSNKTIYVSSNEEIVTLDALVVEFCWDIFENYSNFEDVGRE